jgi:hypothetical protein
MKNQIFRVAATALILALTMATIPVSVYAQLGVTSIQPSSVPFGVASTITIQGANFVDGSTVVLLEGYGALATSFQNASVLTTTVPADVPVGTYNVTISTGAESVTVTGGLTVNPPPAPPPATNTPLPFSRPQFVVRSSRVVGTVRTGAEVNLKVVVENVGQSTAYSSQAAFASTDLVSTKTGGIAAFGTVAYDDEVEFSQSFFVVAQISAIGVVVVDMTITYYDKSGTSFSDKFTLSIPVSGGISSGGGAPAATATPTGVNTSQLVITNYSASVDPLQPGNQFSLAMTVQNMGNVKAQRVTMIVGGGSSGNNDGGTPQPGGVSGGSGEFTNFAPVGASNVQSLGDLEAGGKIEASQNLIVNVSTTPGAYPMKVTFSYLNNKNEIINDEQVITLLVYGLPKVDVSFYRPPDPIMVGQGGLLPIQVVNLGKRSSVLGNITVTSEAGMLENGTSLVGSLDPGGYFTIDSFFTPEQSGTVELDIVIDYVDDFNQPRTIEKTIEVEVMEGFVEEPVDSSVDGGGTEGGEFMPVDQETTTHKIFRFIKGLFGLDSAWPVWQSPGGGGVIDEPSETKPMIAPAGKG